MIIQKIKIENFRNYHEEEVIFHDKVNVIIGDNAQGKTNLLESIYVSSLGRSFRTTKDKEMILFEKPYARIMANYITEDQETKVDVGFSKEGKKEIKMNNVKVEKMTEMLNHFYVVVFSPDDLKIVKEEPEKRRNFIDRELCKMKISYLNNLVQYKRILMQRNAYLKSEKKDRQAMAVWDEALSQYGAQVITQRNAFIEELNEISRQIHDKITQGKEILELKYEPNIKPETDEKTLFEKMKKKLEDHYKSDSYAGNTGVGPHKDDVLILINGISARQYGSQGQQRTAALSMKLAEIYLIEKEKGEKPILLLDDVLSELDQDRQKYLIKALSESQLFITTAELNPQLSESLPQGNFYWVSNGKISRKYMEKNTVDIQKNPTS
jgi:DNA replication and repair protein RecF